MKHILVLKRHKIKLQVLAVLSLTLTFSFCLHAHDKRDWIGSLHPLGKNWIVERHSIEIPGIAESVDLGLAAGGPDKRQYWVEFTDWKIMVAKQQ